MDTNDAYQGYDPEDLKKNWRGYRPPMIPIYYMDINELKKYVEMNPQGLSPVSLELMLGFYEEYEKYEHAAIVRDVKFKNGIFDDSTLDSHDPISDSDDFNPFNSQNPFEK